MMDQSLENSNLDDKKLDNIKYQILVQLDLNKLTI